MTLLISMLMRGNFALQVTDRQLTTITGKPFDHLSNKALIYVARDAIACIAYTGHAFIEDWPTDTWIAKQIMRNAPDSFLRDGGFIHGGPPVSQVGQAVAILESELKASEIGQNKTAFELEIVGWKWKPKDDPFSGRKRPFQFRWLLYQRHGTTLSKEYTVHKYQRGTIFSAIPSLNFSEDRSRELLGRLHQINEENAEVHPSQVSMLFENAIVGMIRETASRNRFVGSDCMSILLAPPHIEPLVRVRFFSDNSYLARDLGMESAPQEHEASFTPWIIGPTSAVSPQIVTGEGWEYRIGPYTIRFDGKPTPPVFDGGKRKWQMGFSNQLRPPRPK